MRPADERLQIGPHNCESGRGRNDAANCVRSPFEPLSVFRGFISEKLGRPRATGPTSAARPTAAESPDKPLGPMDRWQGRFARKERLWNKGRLPLPTGSLFFLWQPE